MASTLRKVRGQLSWTLRSDLTQIHLTQLGGHLAPVQFKLGNKTIEPLSVAPWVEEKLDPKLPAILRVLRGDFFCMPFGGNSTPYRHEKHPVHGQTANAKWSLMEVEHTKDHALLHTQLKTTVRPGLVDKLILLLNGQTNVYQQHILRHMTGPMNLGHHAMLKFPPQEHSGLLSTSPIERGQVYIDLFEKPEERGYSSLKPAAVFESLGAVPMMNGELADLSRYPARQGFEDLVILVNKPVEPMAWTAVAFPQQGYVWFALKNPLMLRQTILWISHGGRHAAPWNGRHLAVMGIEEVTSYFHGGLAESVAPNPISKRGSPTCLMLSKDKPTVINYIFGIAPIPARFDHVFNIEPAPSGNAITLTSRSGKTTRAAVNLSFLHAPAMVE